MYKCIRVEKPLSVLLIFSLGISSKAHQCYGSAYIGQTGYRRRVNSPKKIYLFYPFLLKQKLKNALN